MCISPSGLAQIDAAQLAAYGTPSPVATVDTSSSAADESIEASNYYLITAGQTECYILFHGGGDSASNDNSTPSVYLPAGSARLFYSSFTYLSYIEGADGTGKLNIVKMV